MLLPTFWNPVLDTAGVTFAPNKIKGCVNSAGGGLQHLITFAVTNGGTHRNPKPVFNYDAITIAGNSNTGSATYSGSPTLGDKATNGGELKGVNYADAVFTQVSLPEPATWAMMLVGFAMVGYACARRAERLDRDVRIAFYRRGKGQCRAGAREQNSLALFVAAAPSLPRER